MTCLFLIMRMTTGWLVAFFSLEMWSIDTCAASKKATLELDVHNKK